jgi:hypothetical protein
MKNLTEVATALALMAAGVASGSLTLQAQDAGIAHYLITNNDIYRAPNSAAIFQLSGSSLVSGPALPTNGWGRGGTFFGSNGQTVATMASNVCIFVADAGSDDIAAFNAGGFSNPTKVGSYTDPSGSGAYVGTTLAVRGAKLFAGYTASVNIGVWTINSDCSLTLASAASNTPAPAPVDELAVTPDGGTLVATYGQTTPGVGSYAISGSTLTPKGPYNAAAGAAGIDITKDGKYAIVAEYGTTNTQVEVFPINSDSTLGSSTVYSFLQGGVNSNNVALSPDETRLYVNNNNSFQITTLTFLEQAPAGKQLQFLCVSNALQAPAASFLEYTSGLATADITGKGGYLYVVEVSFNPTFDLQSAAVALLQLNGNACPAEVSGSPFPLPAGSTPDTVSAYPQRPF